MRATLISLNLAVPATFLVRGREIETGIFKEPVKRSVRLTRLTLEGDRQVDLRYHGGESKAVYVYPSEHYAYWQPILDRELPPGYFGENFTTEGLLEETVRSGDVFRVGSAVVAVTTPRSPCFKLGMKVGSSRFIKTFLESARLGFYLRVLEEGTVSPGDEIELVRSDAEGLTVAEVIRERAARAADM